MRKNVVFGLHFGGPHDRRGRASIYAFMYGKSSVCISSGVSIFEKKSSYRDEGFVIHLKTPAVTADRFFGFRRFYGVLRDYEVSMGVYLKYGRRN